MGKRKSLEEMKKELEEAGEGVIFKAYPQFHWEDGKGVAVLEFIAPKKPTAEDMLSFYFQMIADQVDEIRRLDRLEKGQKGSYIKLL